MSCKQAVERIRMKKRSCRKIRPLKFWLSLMTVFLLVTGELGAAIAYASPVEGVSDNSILSANSASVQVSVEGTVGDTEVSEAPEVSNNGIAQEEAGATASENSTVSANEEENAEAEKSSELVKEAEEEETSSKEEEPGSEAEEAAAGEESVSNNTVSENTLGELTRDQKETAEVLKEELEKIDRLEEGRDYVPNEAVFMADTRSQAENVAEQYGASLKSFSYGVATIEFSEENKIDTVLTDVVDTVDAVQTAAEIIEEKGDETASIETVAEEDEELAEKVAEVEVSTLPDTPVYTNVMFYAHVSPSDDPLYSSSTAGSITFSSNYQWFHEAINSKAAWDMGADGSGITVAVIDSGIDTSNNDLNSSGRTYISSTYKDNNVTYSITSAEDDHGHGTHCAGIIGGLDNSLGGLGVAPNASIMSIKALGKNGGGSADAVAKAIKQAANSGAKIISMSIGTSEQSDLVKEAVEYAVKKGILCVASAGNGTNNDGQPVDKSNYPGAYKDVIAVANYTKDGSLSSTSNYGTGVDIAAPGTNILSTMPDSNVYASFGNSVTNGCFYGNLSGTSMACPMVAGVAALVWSKYPSLTATQVSEAILSSKTSKTYSYGGHSVTGGVDALAALKAAASLASTITTPETTTPETSTPETSTPVTQNGQLTLIKGQKANVSSAISVSFVKCTTSDSSVAAVTNKGVVTGKKAGSTTITVYTKSGKEYTSTGSVKVYVDDPKLEKMSATYYGQTISAKSKLSGCSNTTPDSWTSSKPSVASVDSSGTVTALKAGSATISAVFGTRKVSANIQVKMPKFSDKPAAILLGGTVTRKVSNVGSGSSISWEYDKSYLSMTASGTYGAKFTLIKATNEDIPVTAKIDGREVGTFNIRMSKMPSLIYPKNIKSGKTGTFKVKNVKVNNSNNIRLTWSAGSNMSLVSSGGAAAKFMATGNAGSYGSVTVSLPGASYTVDSVYIK